MDPKYHRKHHHHHSHYTRFTLYGWVVCGLAALFYCYEYLLRIEPSVMMPQLMSYFHLKAAGLGFLISMYYYAYTPMQAVVGLTTDYFGPKRILTIAIAVCIVGVALFAFSSHITVAVSGRLLVGLGSSFAFVGVLKLAAMWLPHNRFAMFVGLTTALGMLGAMVGDVELTSLLGRITWRQLLNYSALFGVVFLPIFWLFVSERVDRTRERTGTPQSFRLLISEFLSLARSKQMWICGLIGCVMYLSLSAFAELWGIPFVNSLHFATHHFPADFNSLVFLGWLIGAPLNGWLSDKIKSRRAILINHSLISTILFSIVLYTPMTEFTLASCLFLFGLFSSGQVLVFVVARESTSLKSTATAIGFMNLLVMLGGMTVQPLVGLLLDWHWYGVMINNIRVYSMIDYNRALTIIPIALLVTSMMAFWLKETYGQGQDQ
ncbi:MAG TPA: MFS transporter [Coxiellaceae bacterium]|nr:MFS transporter [Coxiellaceae bacterium]